MSNSLWPHELQPSRLPCPSLSPGACSSLCSLSQWWYLTILFCVVPFSSCPQTFPASGFFSTSWPFASHSQSIGASVSALVLPMNIQGWFPLELTGLISLLSRWLSRSSPALQYERIDSYIDWKDIFSTESLYYRKLYTRKNRDLKMIKCEKHLG